MSLKPRNPWTKRNAYLGRFRLPGFIANHVKVEFLYVPVEPIKVQGNQ